jgi:23S rRNA pseudouridine2605 synthase
MSAPNLPKKPQLLKQPTPPIAAAAKPKRPAKRKNLAVLGERLNKFLANACALSRRAAEELIEQGRVEIDGKLIVDLGARVDAAKQVVTLDGEKVRQKEGRLAIVLNKPVGYLCTASDPEGRDTVYKLVPKGMGLHTIGRLDFNTEGVIVLTTDGDLAERLGHARYSVQRVYEARVRGVPTEETLAKLRRGVRLEDGPARAESAEIVAQTDKNAWVRLVLVEGRNREVRRLMERVGHPVMRLRRVAFAGLTTRGLKLGEWRPLTEIEMVQLQERGHVGNFELPPDPRRKGQTAGTKRVTRKPIAQRSPEAAPVEAPEVPGRKTRRPTGKPSHDWKPPESSKPKKKGPPAQKQPPQRPRPEAVERSTDGRRRSTTRENGARGRTPSR